MKIENETYKILMVIAGGFIFAAGVNLFIVPLNLYSGGVIGIAQIIRTIIIQYAHISLPANFDVAGIINFLMNLPLFILAYRSISRKFFVKTLLCVIAQTLAFSLYTGNTYPRRCACQLFDRGHHLWLWYWYCIA